MSTHAANHALADAAQLEQMLGAAGFSDVRVNRETRRGRIPSFDEYWAPIEAGIGSLPQAYLALPDESRLTVRDEVRRRLVQFETDGELALSVEMLIASGKA